MRFALIVTLLALAAPAVAHAAPPAPVTWCGTDEVTSNRVPDLDLSAAQQVRFVYAVPANAPDNFAATASGIATDAAWIDSWWQTQDPTRTPRFDRYAFPGCAPGFGQLDIGFVRLPNPDFYYQVTQTPSLRLDRDFQQLFPDNEKTIVYFDSPIRNKQVCGETDYLSNTEGGAQGIVYIYLQSRCHLGAAGAGGTAEVAGHELLHNLGAVPDEAPHECPELVPSHACDSTTDIMYPFISDGSTLDTVQLDVGHDDYYAHSGSWWDVQDSNWLSHLPQYPFTLRSPGHGTLPRARAAMRASLACNTGCSGMPIDNGTRSPSIAIPAAGYGFAAGRGRLQRNGDADVHGGELSAATSATARFVKAALRVTVAVAGKGRVASSPAGIACPGTCTKAFAVTSVKLTAKPAAGSTFAGWSGACTGTRPRARSRSPEPHAPALFSGRRPHPVEERAEPGLADREHQREMLFERTRLVEPAGVHRLVARVADQLLDLARAPVLRCVEVRRPFRLRVDRVVDRREVEVERLRRRAAHDRLDLVRVRLERLVAASDRIRRVHRHLSARRPRPSRARWRSRAGGTATSTTSAFDASPPSRPSSCTSCPAARQRSASPPPHFPYRSQ